MNREREFIGELNKLYKRTGIRLENFGDMNYDPYLIIDGDVNAHTGDRVYIRFDIEKDEYVGRLGDPYGDRLI